MRWLCITDYLLSAQTLLATRQKLVSPAERHNLLQPLSELINFAAARQGVLNFLTASAYQMTLLIKILICKIPHLTLFIQWQQLFTFSSPSWIVRKGAVTVQQTGEEGRVSFMVAWVAMQTQRRDRCQI